MVLNGTVHDVHYSIDVQCTLLNVEWSANGVRVDFDDIKCQCGKGFKQGTGDAVATCVPCLDGTYAPLNVHRERAECRGCPREGVNCNDGVLVIQDDFWYDADVAMRPDGEGNLGISAATTMYPCAMREACLVNRSVAPMTMVCHENHTGVMCARCFSRRVDCGRAANGEAHDTACAEPQYNDRSEEWMYFAMIARHCTRCPAGSEATSAYVITILLLATFAIALVAVVVHRMASASKRVKGKARSDASGIARVFFNWIQMVSMLQSIKMQPPEEVTNAMETAEVANVSIEWFPVQCTLRLTFFSRVAVYMVMPLFAVLVPLVYVLIISKCTPVMRRLAAKQRRAKRIGKKVGAVAKWAFKVGSLLIGDDLKSKKQRAHRADIKRYDDGSEIERLQLEMDQLLDTLAATEIELGDLQASIADAAQEAEACGGGARAEKTADAEDAEHPAEGGPDRSADAESAADDDAIVRIAGRAFFQVADASDPIALRAAPSTDAAELEWGLRSGDVIASEQIEEHGGYAFARLTGAWGEGWAGGALPDGTAVLREVASHELVDAAADPVEAHYRDEVRHCFRAICAMSQTSAAAARDTITRESIEYALPAKWTKEELNTFFADYDADGDGTIDFSEFVAMFPQLRAKWRFEDAWAEFQHLDRNGDGTLGVDEVRTLVPAGASGAEIERWMATYDRGGKGFVTMSDYVAIDGAVQRDTLTLSVGTAIVLCTYFVYSRVTKALLSVYSMEKIEGKMYMKREVGTPALTNAHMGMMAVSGLYLVVFSAAVPLIGLLLMFYMRHEHGERRFTTMAGFLMDGYRPSVAWFWEFVVLARKLIILCVSLFMCVSLRRRGAARAVEWRSRALLTTLAHHSPPPAPLLAAPRSAWTLALLQLGAVSPIVCRNRRPRRCALNPALRPAV
jgi:Ca2+-binding EF-hand superfamily protein